MGQAVGGSQLQDHYHVQKVKLGEGSFGTVWRGVDRMTHEYVAIKQLSKAKLPHRGLRREDVENEIRMMESLNHMNVIRLLRKFEDSQYFYLAVEYCEGGDFGDKVKERGEKYQDGETKRWVWQMLEAIRYLHERGICHRDIKPDNFLVHRAPSPEGPYGAPIETLKLADLGMAVHLAPGERLKHKCGTPAFMAPELHLLPRSLGYSFAVDVWAAGVSMYMMLLGRHPFISSKDELLVQKMLKGDLDFRTSGILGQLGLPGSKPPEEARQLCQEMVTPEPAHRPAAAELLTRRWLREQDPVPYRRRLSENTAAIGAPVLLAPRTLSLDESIKESFDSFWRSVSCTQGSRCRSVQQEAEAEIAVPDPKPAPKVLQAPKAVPPNVLPRGDEVAAEPAKAAPEEGRPQAAAPPPVDAGAPFRHPRAQSEPPPRGKGRCLPCAPRALSAPRTAVSQLAAEIRRRLPRSTSRPRPPSSRPPSADAKALPQPPAMTPRPIRVIGPGGVLLRGVRG